MSSNLAKKYHLQLRRAFDDSLLSGTFAPLDTLNTALKDKKGTLKVNPIPIMNGLEEAMSRKEEDMREARHIISDAKQRDIAIASISTENEHTRRNPYRDEHLHLIKKSRETIKIIKKDKKLWYARRPYTPQANAKHVVGFSLAGSFLLAATMAAVDFLDKTTLSLSSDGLIFSCIIGATAGAIGAVRHNNEYYKHSKRGLRHIRKAFRVDLH